MNSPDVSNKPPLYTMNFLLLSFSTMLMSTGYAFFLVFSFFILHIGGNKSDIGILIGITPLASVLSRPMVSTQVDRIGRKKSYILGCMTIGVPCLAFQFFMQDIDSVFFIHLFLRFLQGIGFAFSIVASLTFVSDLVPKERIVEGLGMFGITPLIGMAVGPMMAEWLILTMGYSFMFITAAVLCGAAMVSVLPLKELYASQPSQRQAGFFRILQHPTLIRITLIALAFGFGFSAHGSFVAPYAKSKDLLTSIYFIAYSIAAICTRLIGGRLADRFGETRIVPFSLSITGIGFLSQLIVDSYAGLFVSGFITGIGHAMVLPCLMSLSIKPVSPQNRGKANGVLTGGMDMGLFSGSFAMGFIGEYLGYTTLFVVAGMSMFIGLIAFLLWRIRFANILHPGI